MNRRPRRNHTPAFKAKVALAAIKPKLRARRSPVFSRMPKFNVEAKSTVSASSIGSGSTAAAMPAIAATEFSVEWGFVQGGELINCTYLLNVHTRVE